jgi:hypothetical protein
MEVDENQETNSEIYVNSKPTSREAAGTVSEPGGGGVVGVIWD